MATKLIHRNIALTEELDEQLAKACEYTGMGSNGLIIEALSRYLEVDKDTFEEATAKLLLTCDRRAVWLQPIASRYGLNAKTICALIDEVERKEEIYSGPYGGSAFAADFPSEYERLTANRKIKINGREKRAVPQVLRYDEIIKLAFDGPFDPPIFDSEGDGDAFVYSVTYHWKGQLEDEPNAVVQGILSPDQSVKIRDGMIISVADTSGA